MVVHGAAGGESCETSTGASPLCSSTSANVAARHARGRDDPELDEPVDRLAAEAAQASAGVLGRAVGEGLRRFHVSEAIRRPRLGGYVRGAQVVAERLDAPPARAAGRASRRARRRRARFGSGRRQPVEARAQQRGRPRPGRARRAAIPPAGGRARRRRADLQPHPPCSSRGSPCARTPLLPATA